MKTITKLEKQLIELKSGRVLKDVDIYALNEMKAEGIQLDKILFGNKNKFIYYSKTLQLQKAS